VHDRITVEESSGNVFADVGLRNPKQRLAKAALAFRIAETIRTRRLTQTQAARILKIDETKTSSVLRGHLSSFSIRRLTRFLTLLERDGKPQPRR
jgi:predicted XRE-type DNA-binding protein